MMGIEFGAAPLPARGARLIERLPPAARRWFPLLALALLTATTLGIGRFWLQGSEPIEDERFHGPQVRKLARGNFTLHPMLTTLPGYHLVVAGVSRLARRSDDDFLRLVSSLLGGACVVVFCLAARRLSGEGAPLAAAQFLYLPILFPFFFLLYTDVFGLLLVLGSVWMWIEGRHQLAGWVGIASVVARQDNVVWLVFLCGLAVAGGGAWLRRSATALAGIALFAVFVVLNRGVAIGDRESHPFPSIGLANIYLALWLQFLLLPFLNWANLGRMARLLRRDRHAALGLVALLGVYMWTFANDHPYNRDPDEYLRNRLLVFASTSLLHKVVLAIPMGIAFLSLWVTPLRHGGSLLFFACASILLGAHWLVEPRYAIVPFALFALLRERRSPAVEWLTLGWSVFLSWALFWAIRGRTAFP